jgi:hypothetical protein
MSSNYPEKEGYMVPRVDMEKVERNIIAPARYLISVS